MTIRIAAAAAAMLCSTLPSASHAEFFAAEVLQYLPGTGVGSFTNPGAALGKPDPITGLGSGFDNVLSPFSPHYETNQLARIGEGGLLTLQLSNFVLIDRTPGVLELGIWTNVALVDTAFPSGTAANPASTFGADSTIVEVSPDNISWFSLNGGNPILFDLPGNYFLNAGPFDSTAPASPQFADFGKPFSGVLSDFDGLAYPQILDRLDGSAGGTWLDLDSLPVEVQQIGYVRFSGVAEGFTFELDAVAINRDLAGATVPEPSAAVTLLAGLAFAGFRRIHRK
jgi:hypothetical protein